MISSIKYLLISLVSHIIFFSLFYFIVYSLYFNKLRLLSIISPGCPISINIVSNQNCNSEKHFFKVKQQEFLYPESSKSKVSKAIKKEIVPQKANLLTSDKTGGIGNTLSNTIPVIDNEDIINCSPPMYPRSSLELGEEGTVVVRVLVDTQGKIVNCKLHKTSGFKNLDHSVMNSVKLWVVNRIPSQKTWIEVNVDFFIS